MRPNALFGVDVWQVTRYLGYSSLTDFFPTMDIKPNPGCANPACQKLQAAFQLLYNSEEAVAARSAAAAAAAGTKEEAATHEDNDWGIEVVNDAGPAAASAGPCTAGQQDGLAAGLQYSFPVRLQICFFAAMRTSQYLLAVRAYISPEIARAGMHIEVRSIVVVMRSSACSSICAGNQQICVSQVALMDPHDLKKDAVEDSTADVDALMSQLHALNTQFPEPLC